jgi:hypothetical protein
MNKEQFAEKYISHYDIDNEGNVYKSDEQFKLDLDLVIQDEIEKRMPTIDEVTKRINEGLYLNGSNPNVAPELFKLGVSFAKSKILKK